MNVSGAWALGYTGKRVVVTILDDGIQPDHPDLAANYDPRASFDINDNDGDPTPQDNGDNKHGTRCAGEVAAVAFNEFCGVGIAYNASIGGVRMLDGTVTDQVEARALSLNPDHVHIYSASWGPEDDGRTVDGPGRLAKRAFVDGIRKGRRGLGSIFVWASGNGGRKQDNCNCDGYTNSIYTLSISSATQNGAKPWYLEECSSTLATTYSSGSPGTDQNIVTCDMDNTYSKSLKDNPGKPITDYLCTLSHTGTSASAPIAAAIAALTLEANPGLTWRDMQHLVVATSRYEPLRWESGWATNAVGRKYSHKFGYGLMDATAMVKLAEKWHTSPTQKVCEISPHTRFYEIPAESKPLEVAMTVTGCKGDPTEVRFLEHVQARISLQFKPRGNLKISLISPSGTSSNLLLPRMRDTDDDSFNDWPFLSVHFWGENPTGTWKLRIENSGYRPAAWAGTLKSWGLVFYGTFERPQTLDHILNNTFHYLPRRTYATTKSTILNECAKSGLFQDEFGRCLSSCPRGSYANTQTATCDTCNVACKTCFGPHHDHCTTCPDDRWFYGDRCVRVCPDTHYGDEEMKECLPCSANCNTCVDTPTNCKSCVSKQVLDSNFKCVAGIPCQNSNDSMCNSICHGSCNTCSGPKAEDCLSCPPERRLLVGQCTLESCPVSYFERSYAGRLECKRCHAACKTCTGPSHSQCIDCSDGFMIKDGICTRCPPGQFLNRAQEIPVCSSCYHDCSECSGSNEDDCTHCDAPLNLMGSRCVPCCTNASVIAGSDCCHCMNGQGPCVTLEHTRSVYGAGESTLEAVAYPSSQWSRRIVQMPSSVISFVAVAVVAVVVVLFVLLNLAMSNKSRLFLKTSWRSQGSSVSSSFTSSLARYRKIPDRDLDLQQLLNEGDDEPEELLFQKT